MHSSTQQGTQQHTAALPHYHITFTIYLFHSDSFSDAILELFCRWLSSKLHMKRYALCCTCHAMSTMVCVTKSAELTVYIWPTGIAHHAAHCMALCSLSIMTASYGLYRALCTLPYNMVSRFMISCHAACTIDSKLHYTHLRAYAGGHYIGMSPE